MIIYEETHPLTWRLKKKKKPIFLKKYLKYNGYNGAKKAITKFSPNEIIEIIKKSGLRGRGGAGFPTGIKWSLIKKKKSYLICNADEMEPGTYKDRFLLENLPHQLIEGIIIASYALQSKCAYIFLRGEYIIAEKNINYAINELLDKKMLGKNIFNSNFSLNIYLHTGAGRYICGEETALINSLEGKRANPRFKPPFPSSSGLWGEPTCVNNVETLSNIPSIIKNGFHWYKNISLSIDSGTKMMGFSGKVNNPGVWELPLGITARELLEDYAHGICNGYSIKAWLPGGAGTNFLLDKHLDLPMDFNSIQKAGSRLGTGLAVIIDNKINMVNLLLNIENFFSRESCGWCTPCRDGLPWIVKILKCLKKKQGKINDINTLKNICNMLQPGKTFCAHAPGALAPLKSAIKYFKNEFEKGIIYK
ncbi:NADH-quinone oxidoreductase subunit F [Candidatus Annandia adelgestsuga]|uniref:NADH-quinone oxidoreductase subunit F n=1 Tax=Candidatus Annandia adelgestsuga TaxID=1302411 RepID=A0A3Q9CLI5_9ENTR|nr:NADH-quinone oxidoreductase subunit NuoF [Candidatus Annandia adelgestsuga]AZP36326.1 NADH-quinone oxidoreductase subunit F [Candidatus Annandia adelgestsuga]